MSILVVGSVAFDSVETPFGKVEKVLGGSATYFSTSASFFTDVNLVAVVGEDFPQEHVDFLKSRNIDLTGLAHEEGKTFQWEGKYGYDLNEAQTLATHLNVFERFKPRIPEPYRDAEFLFLANIDPVLQMEVLSQVQRPRVVACDTMNFWISSKPEELKKLLARVDIFIINEGEARQLSEEANLVKAAKKLLDLGVKTLIVKRGEYGVLMFNSTSVFAAPAYPLGGGFRPYWRRRHLCRRLYGLPGQYRRYLGRRDQAGDHFRQRHGFLQCGGLQPEPSENPQLRRDRRALPQF